MEEEAESWTNTYGDVPPAFAVAVKKGSVHPRQIPDKETLRQKFVEDELDDYLQLVTSMLEEGKMRPSSNPFRFWNLRMKKFPTLSQLALKMLVIAPTSVECERTFSVAGLTDTELRNRLSTEHLDLLIFLKQNLKRADVMERFLNDAFKSVDSMAQANVEPQIVEEEEFA